MTAIEKWSWRLAVITWLLPLGLLAQSSSDTELTAIVRHFDELYRSNSSQGKMEMAIITPNWQRTLKMDVWSEGLDKTFIRITEPLKEKGVATLRMGNEMWNYLPKTNKVIKIPPSMMMSSWMGSDFTNDDLVNEFTMERDFSSRFVTVDSPQTGEWYVEFVPHEGVPVVWGKIVAAIRKSDYLPVWEKDYDEKGNLMRVMYFKEIKDFGGRRVPSIMELIPQNKEGHKTIVRYLEMVFDRKIDQDIFTLRNLRSQS